MNSGAAKRKTVQDLLAGVTFVGLALGLIRFLALREQLPNSVFYDGLAIGCWMFALPASIGLAVGCFVAGWRGAWRYALIAMLLFVLGLCCLLPG
jgi:hypothetical protein